MSLAKVAKKALGLLVKKVTTVGDDGEATTRIKASKGVKGLACIAGFLLVWHFIIQPVLAYHFPEYCFPTLDGGWLCGLLLGV